ncbi:MAG: SGNH/GDSL hydrolase family protein [Proteobacteria bacterium]|nr:SGNH/GDSL hydrolase family protein [Pseudomonadota bacterium]
MRLRKATRLPALLLLVLALPLATGEIYLRATGKYMTWSERSYGQYSSMAENLDSWFPTRKPFFVEWYDNREFRFPLATNSLGVRDVEHPREKPGNEFRVAVLGDSYTEGVGAAVEDAWFRRLEEKLNRRADPGTSFLVLSGAVAGSDPFYCFQMLKQKILDYRPDLVILALGENDVVDVARRGGMERFRPDGTVRIPSPIPAEWLFARSRLYRFVLLGILGRNEYLFTPREFEERMALAIVELAGLSARYQDLCRDHGAAFAVAVFPQKENLEGKGYTPGFTLLVGRLEASGAPVLDLFPSFREAMGQGAEVANLYWPVDRHFQAQGYEVFASAVADGLVREGLVPLSP